MLSIEKTEDMLAIAGGVIWFQSAEESLDDPYLFLAHVMTYGLFEDVLTVRRAFGLEVFREALQFAPAGIFDNRSWAYWNLLCDNWPAPPLPERKLA